jgi:hypothetical protein
MLTSSRAGCGNAPGELATLLNWTGKFNR